MRLDLRRRAAPSPLEETSGLPYGCKAAFGRYFTRLEKTSPSEIRVPPFTQRLRSGIAGRRCRENHIDNKKAGTESTCFLSSMRLDLNQRPLRPERSALPN